MNGNYMYLSGFSLNKNENTTYQMNYNFVIKKKTCTISVHSHLSSPMSFIRKSNALSTLDAYSGKIFFKAKHLYMLKHPGAHKTDPSTCSAAYDFISTYTSFIISILIFFSFFFFCYHTLKCVVK